MIKSMTGFGQAVLNRGDISISVEIKSLNSKFLDLSLRLPRIFSDKELELRAIPVPCRKKSSATLDSDQGI